MDALPSAAPATRPAIATLTEATVRYDSHLALAGATLEIRRAAITTVVGHNGSGKSTLLGALAGTATLSSGTLTWHAFDAAPGRIAFVPQHARLPDAFPVTVGAAVAMGRWARGSEQRGIFAMRAGRRGPGRRRDAEQVDSAIDRLGLGPLRGRLLSQLSGGQRQRTLVAQGIAQDTEVLLFDEPTSGVDAESSARIAASFAALAAEGKTVVIASHDAGEIQAADVIVTLRDGRVVEAASARREPEGGALRH